MRLFLIQGDDKQLLQLKDQTIVLDNPRSFFQIDVAKNESCEVIVDKRKYYFDKSSGYVSAYSDKENSIIRFVCSDKKFEVRIRMLGIKEFSLKSMQNLIYFATSVRSLMNGEKTFAVEDLLNSISNGKISLLSIVKPLTGYDNKELVSKIQDELSQKIRSICSEPKKGTRIEELVQDVSLVKRINSSTLSHLASHTEHWKSRTLSGLIPNRLKSEIIEDKIDIYENLFFKMAIDEIYRFTKDQIDNLKKAESEIQKQLDFNKYGEQLLDYRRSEIWQAITNGKDVESGENDKKIYRDARGEWLKVYGTLETIKNSIFYKSIDTVKAKRIGRHIFQTNILKNDQRYKALYDIWRLVCAEEHKQKQEQQGASDDLIKSIDKFYNLYVVTCLLFAMRLIGLEIKKESFIQIDDNNELYVNVVASDALFAYTITTSYNYLGKTVYTLEIKEFVNKQYDVPSNCVELLLETDLSKITNKIYCIKGEENVLFVRNRLSQQEQAELRKIANVSHSELTRMNRSERVAFDRRKKSWDEFINRIASDENLREPMVVKLDIYPLFLQYDENEKDVNLLASKLFSTKTNDNNIIYCMPVNIMDHKTFKEESLRMILNHGESFYFDQSKDWKDYKISTFPILQTDFSSTQRFMKLISVHRAKLLMTIEEKECEHCPICYSYNIKQEEGDMWRCQDDNCGVRFGTTKCVHGCGCSYQWIKPSVELKPDTVNKLVDGSPLQKVLDKESIFDRLIITDFEFEKIAKEPKMYPICPKCGKRRFS